MIRSKFKPFLLGFNIAVTIFLTGVICVGILGLIYSADLSDGIWWFMLLLCASFTWIWVGIIFESLRKHANKIHITGHTLIVKRFLGLVPPVEYHFSELEGYNLLVTPSMQSKDMQTILLIKNGRRIGHISNYFHRNFDQLNLHIRERLPDLGKENYSLFRESMEIFR